MPKRMARPQWERFLRERRVCVLATLDAEGRPVLTPVWYLYRDGRLLIRTGADSAKARNVARDPRVTVCVQDERPPYRNAIVYGAAAVEAGEDGLGAQIAKRYLGSVAGAAYQRTARETVEQGAEVTIVVTPQRVVTQDYGPEVPFPARLWLLAKRILPPGL